MGDSYTDNSNLYDRDFARWAHDQAQRIREAAALPEGIDHEHLAEEVACLGKDEYLQARRYAEIVLAYLIALPHAPANRKLRDGWANHLSFAQSFLEKTVRDSPSVWERLKAEEADLRDSAHLRAQLIFHRSGLDPPELPPSTTPLDRIFEE